MEFSWIAAAMVVLLLLCGGIYGKKFYRSVRQWQQKQARLDAINKEYEAWQSLNIQGSVQGCLSPRLDLFLTACGFIWVEALGFVTQGLQRAGTVAFDNPLLGTSCLRTSNSCRFSGKWLGS
ncbi:unnamed protein product [Symbiodinium necroappetens]|uniref:Uncharacterized protein n=1 Tax=Symbiodinium necroappetens TaxID=1628268 RepID=A0A812W6Y7_9DINO|nr:unnamed protein product [Symbiodinium necroappetens]